MIKPLLHKKPQQPVATDSKLIGYEKSLLDALERAANIGHFKWDFANARLESCSEGFAQIYAMSIAEVMDAQSDWGKTLKQIHPEDREAYEKLVMATGGESVVDTRYRIFRKGGEIRYVKEIDVLIFDDAGQKVESIGTLQDITDQVKSKLDLEYREALSKQAEAITDIGHFICDETSQTYSYISPGYARIHGLSVAECLRSINSLAEDFADVHVDDVDSLTAIYEQYLQDKKGYTAEYRIHRSDGEIRWIREMSSAYKFNQSGEIEQTLGVLQDITESKSIESELHDAKHQLEAAVAERTRELASTIDQLQLEIREREKISAELKHMANHDALTGLPSLRLCKDRLERSLAESSRDKKMSAVLFIDLDGFKQINDSYGHEFGDHVLKLVAVRIKSVIREIDTVARIGGDEFVVVLSRLSDLQVVKRISTDLVRAIAREMQVELLSVAVSASIGIAMYPRNGNTPEQLIREADAAMYRVKHAAKNNFGFAQSA